MKENSIYRQEKLWSKYFVLITLINLLTSIMHFLLFTSLPLYAKELGGSNFYAGLVTSIYSFSALFFRPLFGNFMDKSGRKIVLIIGTLISIVVSLSYNFVYSVSLLLVLRFINGIGFSANSTTSGAVVGDLIPASRLSEGIGVFGVSTTIANAIGPALGLYIINRSGYPMLFAFVMIVGIISFIGTWFLNYEKDTERKLPGSFKHLSVITKKQNNEVKKSQIFEPTSILPSAVMFFLAMGACTITTFIPAYALSLGIENIGMFYTLYASSTMASRVFVGKYADRYGVQKVFVPGASIVFLSYLVLAFFKSFYMILFAGILYGFGYGIVFPVVNAIVMKLCPPERRGVASATFFSAMDIAMSLGGAIWGVVSDVAGYKAIFLGASAFTVIAIYVFNFILVNKNKI